MTSNIFLRKNIFSVSKELKRNINRKLEEREMQWEHKPQGISPIFPPDDFEIQYSCL